MDVTQTIFPLIESGDTATVQSLLDAQPGLVHSRKAGAEQGQMGASTLQAAAAAGHLEIVRLLVAMGAEVYTNPMNQYPPIMEAFWKRHTPVVNYFLNEIPEKADGTNGLGIAINLAGRCGWTEIVRKHIERDPLSIHSRGWIGDTPLHWPSHNNFVEIVEMLISAGADIEADEIYWIGGKPLHWASEHAPGTVRVLLDAGADVNSRNVKSGSEFEGVTPLIMNATQKNDCAEVTEMLLATGADITATDATGRTALDHATARSLTRITAALRSAGAG